jgi:hypothetical protein
VGHVDDEALRLQAAPERVDQADLVVDDQQTHRFSS